MVPLGMLAEGETAEVLKIHSGKGESSKLSMTLCRMEEMGVSVGKQVKVLKSSGMGQSC